jgi:hypothetical protein
MAINSYLQDEDLRRQFLKELRGQEETPKKESKEDWPNEPFLKAWRDFVNALAVKVLEKNIEENFPLNMRKRYINREQPQSLRDNNTWSNK